MSGNIQVIIYGGGGQVVENLEGVKISVNHHKENADIVCFIDDPEENATLKEFTERHLDRLITPKDLPKLTHLIVTGKQTISAFSL